MNDEFNEGGKISSNSVSAKFASLEYKQYIPD